MKVDFEYFTNLQYKVKILTAKVEAFESGETYITLRQTFEKLLRAKDQENRALKEELAKAHSQMVTVRNHWFEAIDDMKKEKRLQKTRELYEALTELEEEREKNRKLTA
nr:hypothetical protein [uncultured Schaedlerella sp.]